MKSAQGRAPLLAGEIPAASATHDLTALSENPRRLPANFTDRARPSNFSPALSSNRRRSKILHREPPQIAIAQPSTAIDAAPHSPPKSRGD